MVERKDGTFWCNLTQNGGFPELGWFNTGDKEVGADGNVWSRVERRTRGFSFERTPDGGHVFIYGYENPEQDAHLMSAALLEYGSEEDIKMDLKSQGLISCVARELQAAFAAFLAGERRFSLYIAFSNGKTFTCRDLTEEEAEELQEQVASQRTVFIRYRDTKKIMCTIMTHNVSYCCRVLT